MIQDSVRDEMDTEDGTTPRPWRARRMDITDSDQRHWCVVRADEENWPGKTYVTFINTASSGADADARLIVEAVNSYDRLRAIERAARQAMSSMKWSDDGDDALYAVSEADLRALRAALTPEADAPSERAELEETGR